MSFAFNAKTIFDLRDSDKRETNADKIRSMSDEELADFLGKINSYEICTEWAKSFQIGGKTYAVEDSQEKILQWLRSEKE